MQGGEDGYFTDEVLCRLIKKIKENYPDTLVFFRLGDFYEMFFDDAINVSRELELTLTGRDCGLDERAPMCGVPFHAVDNYVSKLIEKGYRVKYTAIGRLVDESFSKVIEENSFITHETPR